MFSKIRTSHVCISGLFETHETKSDSIPYPTAAVDVRRSASADCLRVVSAGEDIGQRDGKQGRPGDGDGRGSGLEHPLATNGNVKVPDHGPVENKEEECGAKAGEDLAQYHVGHHHVRIPLMRRLRQIIARSLSDRMNTS